jgi:hypothetical protein
MLRNGINGISKKKYGLHLKKFDYPAMQRNIQEKGILTHTNTNASKLTSDYFFVARATYNTKHVISCPNLST